MGWLGRGPEALRGREGRDHLYNYSCHTIDTLYFCILYCVHFLDVVASLGTLFSCPGSSIPDLGQSVSDSVTDCHCRISTQRVAFET